MINYGIFAQTAPAGGAGGAGGMAQILLMVGIFVIFYLVLILPESRRRKKLQNEIKELKIGDRVMTSGGIHGVIEFVGDKTFYIKSADAKFEVAKESVAAVIKK